jgi:hypothetical protein
MRSGTVTAISLPPLIKGQFDTNATKVRVKTHIAQLIFASLLQNAVMPEGRNNPAVVNRTQSYNQMLFQPPQLALPMQTLSAV